MDIKDSKFMEGFQRLTADAFQKGWHERNGGNLTYRVKTEEVDAVKESLHEVKEWQPMAIPFRDLPGNISWLREAANICAMSPWHRKKTRPS